jgi:hypothetical protein
VISFDAAALVAAAGVVEKACDDVWPRSLVESRLVTEGVPGIGRLVSFAAAAWNEQTSRDRSSAGETALALRGTARSWLEHEEKLVDRHKSLLREVLR